jgi:ribosomal protein L12E/L44/L45/RPP1/RPP2
MDEDEDDMYGPGDVQNELITNGTQQQSSGHGMKNDQHAKKEDEDEDEDEDDDDDDDDEDEDESDSVSALFSWL